MIEEKKEINSFCSVNPMQTITFFSLFIFPPTSPSSLESTNHQTVLSGQAIFKRVNICVFVCVLFFLQ